MCFLEPAQCNFYTRIKQLDLPTQDWYMLEILQERGWKDGNNGGGGFSQVRECGAKAHLSFILYLPLICQQPLIRRLITSDHLISANRHFYQLFSWIYTLQRLFSDVHFGFCSPARMTVIGMYVFTGEQIIKPDPGLISQWLAIIDDSESDQPVISTSALSRIRIWYFSISPIPRIPSSHFYW